MIWLAVVVLVVVTVLRVAFLLADKRYQAGKLTLTAVDGRNGRSYYVYGGGYVRPARVQLQVLEEEPRAITAGPEIVLELPAADPVVQ